MSAVHAAQMGVRVDGELLPAAIVAQRLGVSKQLVYWWVKSGKLQPAQEVNGRSLYLLKDAARVELATKLSPYSRRSAAA